MKFRYIYSACGVVETKDVRILMDPWFTQGAFDGSWYQYPVPTGDHLELTGPADYVYVSHIHPDHYDPVFLKRYLARYPDAKLIVGDTKPPFLPKKMRADGFTPQVVTDLQVGKTTISIIPNHAYEYAAVDTCLVVSDGKRSLVNLNDNHFDAEQIRLVLERCPNGTPTLALIPYNGAGPYPQTYLFESEEQRRDAVDRVRKTWLGRYERYVEILKPARAIPFAGLYFLGGPLSELNKRRAYNDALDLIAVHAATVVPADGGNAVLDLETLRLSEARTKPYDEADIARTLAAASFEGYDYEREIAPLPFHRFQLQPLLQAAVHAALGRAKLEAPLWFVIRPSGQSEAFAFEPLANQDVRLVSDCGDLSPRMEITVDARYLYGLLTRFYHWNNAEIGSHLRTARSPDVFRRDSHNFLNFLHV